MCTVDRVGRGADVMCACRGEGWVGQWEVRG
jgi:hypothetical protein